MFAGGGTESGILEGMSTSARAGLLLSTVFIVAVLPLAAQTPQLATDEPTGSLEAVATYPGPMLTGVTASHHGRIFVSTAALRDRSMSDDQVAATFLTMVAKGPSDGLESEAAGNAYAGDYESNSIEKIAPDGKITTIVHDPRLLWPDTMSLADDGYLYVTANQLHRQPTMHDGQDLRHKPYVLFRIKTDSHRISLKR
jgi:sugar lactone lactonase YvrE